MLITSAVVFSAFGQEPIVLNAEYNNIEHQINGLIRSEQDIWLTPLNELTTPNVQWLVERSFPYEINHGQVTITEQQEQIGFNALVPRRWDLSGWSSSGLYMNGLWHPQSPEERNEEWTIHLKAQETSWIILNGKMAQGSITWSGTGHAHDLAILSKVEIHETGNHTVVSTRNAERKAKRLEECLSREYPKTMVVVAPMRHRLAVAGQHQVWLSEHALEGNLNLWKAHCDTVDRIFQSVHSVEATHWNRQLEGYLRTQPKSIIEPSLDKWKWLPQIDFILYSGRLPYQSDIFNRIPLYSVPTWADAHQQQYPVSHVYHNIQRKLTSQQLLLLTHGTAQLDEKLGSMGITEAQLAQWRSEPPAQNYFIRQKEGTVWLYHSGSSLSLLNTTIPVRIDGTVHSIQFDSPNGRVSLPEGEEYWIDPEETLLQASTLDDHYPQKWHFTGLLFPYSISTDNWYPSISGTLSARPHAKHPLRIVSSINTSPTTLLSFEQFLTYGWGELLDSRARPWNSWISAGVQFPDDFNKPVKTLRVGISYNNRSSWLFPREGLGSQFSVGRAQSSIQKWMTSQAAWTQMVNLNNRIVLVERLSGSFTGSDDYDTQIPIGGFKAVAGRSVEAERGHIRAVSNTEMRLMVMRGHNHHLPFLRWTDMIAHVGYDIGYLDSLDDKTAMGLFTGLSFAGDGLHVMPGYFGLSMGWSPDHQPQYYVHIAHRL